jgi:predicted aconitase
MQLRSQEIQMMNGKFGWAAQKSMEILVALGKIYGAEQMIPISSVQISGVSYANLGEAGLQFLDEMAQGGGKIKVLTTLNPAGMDIENWQILGIDEKFAANQMRVIDAYGRMNVITTCTCTPYLSGNLPHYGEHIAWAESSAVCYANSVIGARTNREGGPSALAAALTGVTPEYGYHLSAERVPSITIRVNAELENNHQFGALGHALSKVFEDQSIRPIPYIQGIHQASVENLKSFCASFATYCGGALFHMENITPEYSLFPAPDRIVVLNKKDIEDSIERMNSANDEMIDFVSLGCPHLSIKEIARIAELLQGKKVNKEFWITTSRPAKKIADSMGYSKIIEESGAKFAVDTCCVVAPIKGRFRAIATDSAKACYYAFSQNNMKTRLLSFDDTIFEALK